MTPCSLSRRRAGLSTPPLCLTGGPRTESPPEGGLALRRPRALLGSDKPLAGSWLPGISLTPRKLGRAAQLCRAHCHRDFPRAPVPACGRRLLRPQPGQPRPGPAGGSRPAGSEPWTMVETLRLPLSAPGPRPTRGRVRTPSCALGTERAQLRARAPPAPPGTCGGARPWSWAELVLSWTRGFRSALTCPPGLPVP